ncbi:MAG: hypothetical protein M1812_005667 [Candelaria pacifica]|nr:MAG: hypothetical protein M1812_005667 [Candelaria pacifica]
MAKGEAWKQSKTDTVHKTPNKAGARKPSTSTPTKASKKRGKPEIDPAVGFTIPAKAARSLLDRGWVKMSTRSAPVPGSSITPGSTITDNANVVARVPQNQMSVTASGAAGLVDTTRLTTTEDTPLATATHQQTTNISQLPVHGNEAPALSASHSTKGIEAKDEGQSKQEDDIEGDDEDDEGSQSESSVDDPADKSWGNRRKSTTPRKRKSTGQRSKRSRRG